MHTSHSCIIVTEMLESEPVEPEPGVEFLVEPEENQAAMHDPLRLFKIDAI